MAKTVDSAFVDFNRDYVNLIPERTTLARSSRDWLISQLINLPTKVDDFPNLYDGMHVKFGSFARNTKIRPLDDIDLILTFSAEGSKYWTHTYGQLYLLQVPYSSMRLRKLCDNGFLNSRKLINKLKSSLTDIPQYASSEVHRQGEAATLKLSSYEWNYDIVPAFYTDTGYYLIPDGSGAWKATDPRIDQDRATRINQKHGGKILQIIRTLKYWNRRANIKTIPSYLYENIILDYFDSKDEIPEWIDYNLRHFWNYLKTSIYGTVNDPKNFQPNLNNLDLLTMFSISKKAEGTYNKSYEAYIYEVERNNHHKAINKWREIFGDNFPVFDGVSIA